MSEAVEGHSHLSGIGRAEHDDGTPECSPEVVIDGVRYVPAPTAPAVVDTPDMPGYDKWIPAVGDRVWSTFDSGPPMGVVVGYLHHPGAPRHGQPVIEVEDDQVGWLGRKKGSQFIVHPMFVWPFCPGSDEHKQAVAAGRFDG